MVIRRVLLGLDPTPDDEQCLRLITHALVDTTTRPWGGVPDVYLRMLSHVQAQACGRRWLCLGTGRWEEPLESYDATNAMLGQLSSASSCAIMIDELRRLVAFSAWIRWAESYTLASCGSLLSGDVGLISVEYPQRDRPLGDLARLENVPRARRSPSDQRLLDSALDAATLGLAQWFPSCLRESWSYRQAFEAEPAYRLSAEGRWLTTPRQVRGARVDLVDLHELRPDYRQIAVPWDPATWSIADNAAAG